MITRSELATKGRRRDGGPGKGAQIDLEQRHNRAIAFLRKRKHQITKTEDGLHVYVDGKKVRVLDLCKLANELHGAEWRASEKKFTETLKRKRP